MGSNSSKEKSSTVRVDEKWRGTEAEENEKVRRGGE